MQFNFIYHLLNLPCAIVYAGGLIIFFLKYRYYIVPASEGSIAGHKKRYIHSGIHYRYPGLWRYEDQYSVARKTVHISS